MFAIRLSIACFALLTMALTTFVTVGLQPASGRVVACAELLEPVRA
jgi:hypothetical protein